MSQGEVMTTSQKGDDARLVTVCAACLRAYFWQGEFYCGEYRSAGTVDKTIDDLRAGQYGESEHYWTRLP